MPPATPSLGESLKAAAGPWVVSRFLALASLALARFLVSHFSLSGHAASAAHAGMLGADAGWYRLIAVSGYPSGTGGPIRFFPLYPLVARGIAVVPGVDAGAALLIISNVAAFAAFALIAALVMSEFGDERTAQLSAWMLAIGPAGYVLVMGYAEALLLVLSLVVFLAIRRGAFTWAIPAALLAGACRPVGILLAAPILVEVLRSRGILFSDEGRRAQTVRRGIGGIVVQTAAVLAAPVGAAGYFAWVSATGRGSFLSPLRQQLSSARRGGFTDPVSTFVHDLKDLAHLQHIGTALHAPWAIIFVALAVVALLRLPASYSIYAWLTLAVILTAANLDSLERYGLACFPLAIAAAVVCRRRQVALAVLACLGAAVLAYGTLVFLGAYVP